MLNHYITLGTHWLVIAILTALFIGFKFGYNKKAWDQARVQMRIWKREQAKQPKAYRITRRQSRGLKQFFQGKKQSA